MSETVLVNRISEMIRNYWVEVDKYDVYGSPTELEIIKQCNTLVQIVQHIESECAQDEITDICQNMEGGYKGISAVRYMYYGVPSSLDEFKENGVIYLQFTWTPFQSIHVVDLGYLPNLKPVIRDTISHMNKQWDALRKEYLKYRCINAFDVRYKIPESISADEYSTFRITDLFMDMNEVTEYYHSMGRLFIEDLQTDLLQNFRKAYNKTLVQLRTDGSADLIKKIYQDFQTLVTNLEDNEIQEPELITTLELVTMHLTKIVHDRKESQNYDEFDDDYYDVENAEEFDDESDD